MKLFTAIIIIIGCIFITLKSFDFVKLGTKEKFRGVDFNRVQKIEFFSKKPYVITNKVDIYSICYKINNCSKKKKSPWIKRASLGTVAFFSDAKEVLKLSCYTKKVYSVNNYYFSTDFYLINLKGEPVVSKYSPMDEYCD